MHKVDRLIFERFGEIGWGGNGGFHALNLAIQFGARKVALVGFDMNLVKGQHWHGSHPAPLTNPRQATVDRWRAALDDQAALLHRMGIEVVVASPDSALQNYRRQTLQEVIDTWPDQSKPKI